MGQWPLGAAVHSTGSLQAASPKALQPPSPHFAALHRLQLCVHGVIRAVWQEERMCGASVIQSVLLAGNMFTTFPLLQRCPLQLAHRRLIRNCLGCLAGTMESMPLKWGWIGCPKRTLNCTSEGSFYAAVFCLVLPFPFFCMLALPFCALKTYSSTATLELYSKNHQSGVCKICDRITESIT